MQLGAEHVEQQVEDPVLGLVVPGRRQRRGRRSRPRPPSARCPPTGVSTGRKTSSRCFGRSRQRVGRLSNMVIEYRLTQNRFWPEVAEQLEPPGVAPDSTRDRMSVPVGAFASKSRPITAVNWSSVSSTEKSSSPRKLAGNTRRPCRLTTNGFTLLPPGRARSPACCLVLSCGGDPVHDLGHTCCRTRNAPVMFLARSDWRGFSSCARSSRGVRPVRRLFRRLANID